MSTIEKKPTTAKPGGSNVRPPAGGRPAAIASVRSVASVATPPRISASFWPGGS